MSCKRLIFFVEVRILVVMMIVSGIPRKSFYLLAPAAVAQLVGVSSPTTEGDGFDSASGHILRLWV